MPTDSACALTLPGPPVPRLGDQDDIVDGARMHAELLHNQSLTHSTRKAAGNALQNHGLLFYVHEDCVRAGGHCRVTELPKRSVRTGSAVGQQLCCFVYFFFFTLLSLWYARDSVMLLRDTPDGYHAPPDF